MSDMNPVPNMLRAEPPLPGSQCEVKLAAAGTERADPAARMATAAAGTAGTGRANPIRTRGHSEKPSSVTAARLTSKLGGASLLAGRRRRPPLATAARAGVDGVSLAYPPGVDGISFTVHPGYS